MTSSCTFYDYKIWLLPYGTPCCPLSNVTQYWTPWHRKLLQIISEMDCIIHTLFHVCKLNRVHTTRSFLHQLNIYSMYIYQIFKIKNVYIYIFTLRMCGMIFHVCIGICRWAWGYLCVWLKFNRAIFFQNININANSPLNQTKPLFTAYLWNHVVSYITTKRHNGKDTLSS